jgi:hypothetical protein
VLAAQVAASADALRTLVATTASTMATQTQNLSNQFTDRLALLERAQYENKGRQGVADPVMADLVLEVKKLSESRSVQAGTHEGNTTSWTLVMGIATVISLIVAAIAGVALLRNGSASAASSQPPQIIYVQPDKSPPAK